MIGIRRGLRGCPGSMMGFCEDWNGGFWRHGLGGGAIVRAVINGVTESCWEGRRGA